MMMPRPSFVTSMGPSPVRGFIAAMSLFLNHWAVVQPPLFRIQALSVRGVLRSVRETLLWGCLQLGCHTVEQLIHLAHGIASRHHREVGRTQVIGAQIALGQVRDRTIIDDRRHLPKLARSCQHRQSDDDNDKPTQRPHHQ